MSSSTGNKKLTATEIMTFIPAGNVYEKAIQFYLEIGFELDYKSDEIATLRMDKCRFFLYNIRNEWTQGNFMMELYVDNLDDWWKYLNELNLPERYEGVKLRIPENYPDNEREIHLIDPCGVQWNISNTK